MTVSAQNVSAYADELVPLADLLFIADLARGMQWDARAGADPAATERENFTRSHVASGTFDAIAWLVGLTDVTPATGVRSADRSPVGIEVQIEVTKRARGELDQASGQALYLGGVLDALDFAMGVRERYWWVPLPDAIRLSRGRRDEFGRAL
ncbi:MAG: hypothetical protein ACRCYU_17725 [Nocardioides sp.]